jgi:FxLD family lantipeptide
MSATITSDAPTRTTAIDDPFAIDLFVITDVPPGHPLAACKGGTDDGCDPTCASACISDGV